MRKLFVIILLLAILCPCTYVSATEPPPSISIDSLETFEQGVINRDESLMIHDKLEWNSMLKAADTFGYPLVADRSSVEDFHMYYCSWQSVYQLRYTINGVKYVFYCYKNSEQPTYRESGYVTYCDILGSEIPLYHAQQLSGEDYLFGVVYFENFSVSVKIFNYASVEDIDFQPFHWSKQLTPLEIKVDPVRTFWVNTLDSLHQNLGILIICIVVIGIILVPTVFMLVVLIVKLVRKVFRRRAVAAK